MDIIFGTKISSDLHYNRINMEDNVTCRMLEGEFISRTRLTVEESSLVEIRPFVLGLRNSVISALMSSGGEFPCAVMGSLPSGHGDCFVDLFTAEQEPRLNKGEDVAPSMHSRIPLNRKDVESIVSRCTRSSSSSSSKASQMDSGSIRAPLADVTGLNWDFAATAARELQRSTHSFAFLPMRLSVYKPGSKFNTPEQDAKGINHIATLVIQIPTQDKCEGGDFVVEAPRNCEWMDPAVLVPSTTGISFIMYFADCPYSNLCPPT